MKLIILLLTTFTAFGQFARPTYNPFNNGGVMMPQYQQPNYNFQRPQFFPQQQYQQQNNFTHGRPNVNYVFQNNFQRPQQQFFPQNQQQFFPQQQNNWQQRPQQTQTNNVPLFTRRFHLNNGYLYGRPTLGYDPKSNKMQPWVRKNLR